MVQSHFAKYLPGADIGDANYVYGTEQGQILEQVLKQCAGDYSRENIVKQARNIRGLSLPTLMPGITINTGPQNGMAYTQLQLQRWNGKFLGPVRRSSGRELGVTQVVAKSGLFFVRTSASGAFLPWKRWLFGVVHFNLCHWQSASCGIAVSRAPGPGWTWTSFASTGSPHSEQIMSGSKCLPHDLCS